MADRDETEDAMDSLTWPDTSRPIVSNSMPPTEPATWPRQGPEAFESPRRRNRWPLVAAIVVVLLAAAIVVWLLI